MEISWNGCSAKDWNDLIARAPQVALEQVWMYGAAYAGSNIGAETHRAVVTVDGEPLALAQIFCRRFGSLGIAAQLLRGPAILRTPPTPDDLAEMMTALRSALRRQKRTFFFWTPDILCKETASAAARSIGMRPVITGHSSARVDLTQSMKAMRSNLHGKWRNALTRAEGESLKIDAKTNRRGIEWLLDKYGSLRRQRRFGGPSAEMLRTIVDGNPKPQILLLRAFKGETAVGGALFLRHGRQATYVIGWSDPTARALNAGTLLLWRGMTGMRDRGATSFDLGGIDTRKAPGIARFKLGAGGTPYTLPGTFL